MAVTKITGLFNRSGHEAPIFAKRARSLILWISANVLVDGLSRNSDHAIHASVRAADMRARVRAPGVTWARTNRLPNESSSVAPCHTAPKCDAVVRQHNNSIKAVSSYGLKDRLIDFAERIAMTGSTLGLDIDVSHRLKVSSLRGEERGSPWGAGSLGRRPGDGGQRGGGEEEDHPCQQGAGARSCGETVKVKLVEFKPYMFIADDCRESEKFLMDREHDEMLKDIKSQLFEPENNIIAVRFGQTDGNAVYKIL